ncbi:SsgA family sporulation/cell division regulator [Frankia sp. CNm7]|uniref:SsgA family sporulation/cell division regulator n=1 Tax=Frankia nepalensis TaxID=1836974 RepID=A0A937RUI8_9ACTN|nr:SsgA family sporulation/cell division regulator [Frankia nepalensis]MBL7499961.1 SsgA family sporulation/cell division regulator [Frankia nepalensis]MBL7512756.1 SsgA family sporulation/cell division regulator [Frankia nepalensis]MBL7517828.1 SsgA family sporulation/cell division regulator [Frankia nepalensis]MBL7632141.1 SsgA family sporulation/cell division regulator [Frankia nepalensis]
MQGLDVTTEFVLDDTSTSGRVTVLVVTWRACDPLAVSLALVSRPDHPALPQGNWVAPRDALRAGLETPTGDGDVRFTPTPGNAEVKVELTDGGRHSTVVLDAEPLRAFLERTEQVVPAGQEHPERELDAVLDELLRA